MTIQFDDKGKFYSDIIRKRLVQTTIETIHHRINGMIYVRGNDRPKDALNEPETFLAVSDATVYDLQGNQLYQTEFIAVNRAHIVWVIPHEESMEEGNEGDEPA